MKPLHAVIPDIHADLERLEWSIGQAEQAGAGLLFLGDLIDAGNGVRAPDDRRVLETVRQLVEQGRARSILGNHELNAILYHRLGPDGNPLRDRVEKNQRQHKSFLQAFGVATADALEWTDWFLKRFPLWLEVDGLRLVHACWSRDAIEAVRSRCPDGRLSPDDLPEIAAKESRFAKAVECLVSGVEVTLPDGCEFEDIYGKRRSAMRTAWWRGDAQTWREAALSIPNPGQLPRGPLPPEVQSFQYGLDNPPVLVGHYKMKGRPQIEMPVASSLDYPETPCVYLWDGSDSLRGEQLRIRPANAGKELRVDP